MTQSATELVKDAIEKKVQEVDAASQRSTGDRESAGPRESRAMTRAELEDVVRDGVREGLAEYEREAASSEGDGRGTTVEPGDVESAVDDAGDDESSTGGSTLPLLLLIGLAAAAVVYRRRRSSDDTHSTDY